MIFTLHVENLSTINCRNLSVTDLRSLLFYTLLFEHLVSGKNGGMFQNWLKNKDRLLSRAHNLLIENNTAMRLFLNTKYW